MVLLLGCMGSTGRHYRTILARLGQRVRCADLEYEKTLDTKDITRVIIATPTDTHYHYVKFFNDKNIDILCEKPIDTSYERVSRLLSGIHVDLRVVCNWAFVLDRCLVPGTHSIIYHNVSSGRDGLAWDCVQIIYLAQDFDIELRTGVPWNITIDGETITPRMIEDSYTKMIATWLRHPDKLWGTQDILKQTAKVEVYIKEHLNKGE